VERRKKSGMKGRTKNSYDIYKRQMIINKYIEKMFPFHPVQIRNPILKQAQNQTTKFPKERKKEEKKT